MVAVIVSHIATETPICNLEPRSANFVYPHCRVVEESGFLLIAVAPRDEFERTPQRVVLYVQLALSGGSYSLKHASLGTKIMCR